MIGLLVPGRIGARGYGLAQAGGALITWADYLRSKGWTTRQVLDRDSGEKETLWQPPGDAPDEGNVRQWSLNKQRNLLPQYQAKMVADAAKAVAANPASFDAVMSESFSRQRNAISAVGANIGGEASPIEPEIPDWQGAGFMPERFFPGGLQPNNVAFTGDMAERYGPLTVAQVLTAIYGPNWKWVPGDGLRFPPNRNYPNPFWVESSPSGFGGFLAKAIPIAAAALIPAGAGALIAKGMMTAAKYDSAQSAAQAQQQGAEAAKANIFAAKNVSERNARLRAWVAQEQAAIGSAMNAYKTDLSAQIASGLSALQNAVQARQITPAGAQSEYQGMIAQARNLYSSYGRDLVSNAKRRFEIEKARA